MNLVFAETVIPDHVSSRTAEPNPFIEVAQHLADDRCKASSFTIAATPEDAKLLTKVRRQLTAAGLVHGVTIRSTTTYAKADAKAKTPASATFTIWAVDKIIKGTRKTRATVSE